MEEKVKKFNYPVALLEPSNENGLPELPMTLEETQALFREMRHDPSFLHIKKIIPLDPEQYCSKLEIPASPLITWTLASPETVDAIRRESVWHPGTSKLPPQSDFIQIHHRITLVNGQQASEDVIPVKKGLAPVETGATAMAASLASLCDLILCIYNEAVAQFPQKVVRVPISEIRVRDIAVYRCIKMLFARDGIEHIKVITDNVQRANSKEVTKHALYTICATCMKLELTHQRCSGCQVTFYCSTECQKKGWAQHKIECSERQKEQAEWDAMVAGFA